MSKNEIQKSWQKALLRRDATIQQAVQNLNDSAMRISLVVDDAGKLVGTISDGDIRRGLLRGLGLEDNVSGVLRRDPLVVPSGMSRSQVLQMMQLNGIQQIPEVDGANRVVGLHLLDEAPGVTERDNLMVIMAGGMGLRLRPHTESCPKPLLPVNGKPILEHILERAKSDGFRRFLISVNYLGEMVEDYFGAGEKWNVQIGYLKEKEPLGTAGSLALIDPLPEEPFVVTNGDVLTDTSYGDLVRFHEKHHSVATMAVRLYEWQHPFGVVQMNGIEIVGFEEKPLSRSHINAGVYCINKEALAYLSAGQPCDMPFLFEKLAEEGKRTVAYPMHEPWLDVGHPEALAAANNR